jgi:hypothetical protein
LYVRVLRLAVCLTLASLVFAGSQAAKLYKQGQEAERAGQITKAYLLYSQAAVLDPGNQFYWIHSEALRQRVPLPAKQGAGEEPAVKIEPPTRSNRPPSRTWWMRASHCPRRS